MDGKYLGKAEQGMIDFGESEQGYENSDNFEMAVEDVGWKDLKNYRALLYLGGTGHLEGVAGCSCNP